MRFVISLMLSFALAVGSGIAKPKLDIPETGFDFGFIFQNSIVSHKYLLRSVGDERVEITSVKPGCGCTKAPVGKNILEPGDSTWIELVFDSKHFQGSLTKGAFIYSSDTTGRHQIIFSGYIINNAQNTQPVSITPYKLDISQLSSKPRTEMEFTLKNGSNQDLTLTLVDFPEDYVTIDFPEKLAGGQSATGKIRLTDTALKEEFEKSFTFEANDPQHSRFTVPIKRTVFKVDRSSSK